MHRYMRIDFDKEGRRVMSQFMKYKEYENSYREGGSNEGMGCLIIVAIPFLIYACLFIAAFIKVILLGG